MKKYLKAILFLTSFIPGLVFADVKSITLNEAISLALGENLQIKTSEREVDAAESRLSRTSSYFLPKIGAESRYEYLDSPYQRQRGATSNLFAELNVFNGFRDWYDRKAKSLEYDQAKIGREKQKLFTKAEVEAKFYKLLSIVESVKAYEEAVKRNDAQKESARRRGGAGLASTADVLEFDLYQSELQAELASFSSELKQAQAEFREIIGQTNDDLQFLPKGNLTHYHVDDTLKSLKDRVPKESQSLISARSAVEQAEANKKVAYGGYLPRLDIKATYGSRGINETEVSPETTIMGVARWEFFSGFDTYNAGNEASAQAAKAEAVLRQTELSTSAQVETAFTKLKAIQDRVDIEAENKVKALKFFDVVASEYKRGVKNSTDMRAAAVLLLQVMVRDIKYRAEFFEQKALLEKAVGGEIKISKGSLSGHVD
jgi:outer membrane protein TolC